VLGDLTGDGPSPGAPDREALCDHFAAELLLPAAALRAASRRAGPAALADRFQVPQAVLRRRLAQLGLREPRPPRGAPV
jgi:Zn-dependent peptidase ImmA (M78 family)